MEWLSFGLELLTFLSASGLLYWGVTKKLKKLEVKEKEIEIIKKQDDEWQELYKEAKDRIKELEDTNSQLLQEKVDLTRASLMKEVEIERQKSIIKQQLWYRCTINGCPNRRPPHVFDKDGNELETPQNSEE